MIVLQQDSFRLNNISSTLAKVGETRIEVNIKLLDNDIKRVGLLISETSNKTKKSNLTSILNYLRTLRSHVIANSALNVTWIYDNYRVDAYPLALVNFEAFGIRTSDYIETGANKLISVSYRDVFEIIAIDMMYRDLGETLLSMEDKLKGIGISSINDGSILLNLFDDSALELSKIYRIADSPYSTSDGKLSWDYFGTAAKDDNEAFTSGRYKDCVDRSIDVASTIIIKDIADKVLEQNLGLRLCTYDEQQFYFYVNKIDEIDFDKIFESIVVRAFGRKFEIKPKIKVF